MSRQNCARKPYFYGKQGLDGLDQDVASWLVYAKGDPVKARRSHSRAMIDAYVLLALFIGVWVAYAAIQYKYDLGYMSLGVVVFAPLVMVGIAGTIPNYNPRPHELVRRPKQKFSQCQDICGDAEMSCYTIWRQPEGNSLEFRYPGESICIVMWFISPEIAKFVFDNAYDAEISKLIDEYLRDGSSISLVKIESLYAQRGAINA